VRRVVRDEEFQDRVLQPQFFNGVGSTPEEFAALIRQELKGAEALVKLIEVTGGTP